MKSIAGIFFRTFGLTMVFATLVSLLATFTLTPLLAAYLFKGKKKDENGNIIEEKPSVVGRILGLFPTALNGIRFVYLKTLSFCLSIPGVLFQVLALIAMLLFVGYMAANHMTVEIMPKQDQGMISIKLEMPVGTNVETTDSIAKIIEDRVKDVPEIVHYSVNVGGSNGFATVNQATMRIKLLKDWEGRTRSTDQIVDSLRPYLADIPDAYIAIKSTSASEMNNNSAGDVVLEINGLKKDSVIKASELIMDRVKETIAGVVDVKTSYEAGKPEIRLVPNRQALADYGVTLQSLATYNYIAVSGYEAGQYTEDDPVFRHEKHRHNRYQRSRAEDQKSPLQRLPVKAPAEAREENKGPAYALLPDVTGKRVVPGRLQSAEEDRVPHAVVQDHADHGEAPQSIQPDQPFRAVPARTVPRFGHRPLLLPFHRLFRNLLSGSVSFVCLTGCL